MLPGAATPPPGPWLHLSYQLPSAALLHLLTPPSTYTPLTYTPLYKKKDRIAGDGATSVCVLESASENVEIQSRVVSIVAMSSGRDASRLQ